MFDIRIAGTPAKCYSLAIFKDGQLYTGPTDYPKARALPDALEAAQLLLESINRDEGLDLTPRECINIDFDSILKHMGHDLDAIIYFARLVKHNNGAGPHPLEGRAPKHDYLILVESDSSKQGRYQLSLQRDGEKACKPFQAGINSFIEIMQFAWQLKEVIEQETGRELPLPGCIAISGEAMEKYSKSDPEMLEFIVKAKPSLAAAAIPDRVNFIK